LGGGGGFDGQDLGFVATIYNEAFLSVDRGSVQMF
jgi:hypothetical protein